MPTGFDWIGSAFYRQPKAGVMRPKAKRFKGSKAAKRAARGRR